MFLWKIESVSFVRGQAQEKASWFLAKELIICRDSCQGSF